ncbi:MAG: alpha/beta hydrolase [Polyangiales bacterium]
MTVGRAPRQRDRGGPKLWSSEIAHFADGYRWLSGSTTRAASIPVAGGLIERQVGDALAILDAESVEQTAIVGWSFGAKVAMELFRRAPRRVASLVLVGAVAGNPWEHRSIAGSVLPRVLRLSNRFGGALESVMTRAARWPETSLWARRLGVVSPTLSTELGSELADALGQIDFERVRTFLRAMETHDASDVLHAIDVPVLVISGDRDFASTREAAEHIVRSVRGAELMTVPGGSHFVHAEYPG